MLGLSAAWALLVLVVDPRGDFPLLDDWSYGRSVKILVEEGRLFYDGWNTPTLTLQVLWGALFSMPFGFSFEALRTAALVAGLAGVLGTYALLREAGADPRLSMVGGLTVMLNPGYFQHSFSFMTDVPFTALAVWSAVFFVRSLKAQRSRDAVYGTLLACCAVLVRQPGIALALGYALALLAACPFGGRNVVRAILPTVTVAGVLVVHGRVLEHLQITPAMAGAFNAAIAAQLQSRGLGG